MPKIDVMTLNESLLETSIPSGGHTVILIRSASMGEGDPELGQALLADYLRALHEIPDGSSTIVLYHEGVKVLTEAHPAYRSLLDLVRPGMEILACQRSLRYHDVSPDPESGVDAVSMMTLAMRIDEATKVITI